MISGRNSRRLRRGIIKRLALGALDNSFLVSDLGIQVVKNFSHGIHGNKDEKSKTGFAGLMGNRIAAPRLLKLNPLDSHRVGVFKKFRGAQFSWDVSEYMEAKDVRLLYAKPTKRQIQQPAGGAIDWNANPFGNDEIEAVEETKIEQESNGISFDAYVDFTV
ncbi:hypothetical protein L1987_71161 [Smallanthus sonchifolius]|uniref:Uncharacterized protein n=1 Tax=Smallanthus sonchifolius TaxID=185202 RepID=A0ACB9AT10_9ASTR|nr:hypothetical protein L1987_71161 [Smallanthus sonchifolius]